MARSYCSMVLPHAADEVWMTIRPFDHYAWSGVPGTAIIEADKAGDQVGAIRRIALHDGTMRRQVLLANPTSSGPIPITYALCDPPRLPLRNFVATNRVTPAVKNCQAFVEWWATFDCAVDEFARWTRYFEIDGFAKWLGALRAFIASRQRDGAHAAVQ